MVTAIKSPLPPYQDDGETSSPPTYIVLCLIQNQLHFTPRREVSIPNKGFSFYHLTEFKNQLARQGMFSCRTHPELAFVPHKLSPSYTTRITFYKIDAYLKPVQGEVMYAQYLLVQTLDETWYDRVVAGVSKPKREPKIRIIRVEKRPNKMLFPNPYASQAFFCDSRSLLPRSQTQSAYWDDTLSRALRSKFDHAYRPEDVVVERWDTRAPRYWNALGMEKDEVERMVQDYGWRKSDGKPCWKVRTVDCDSETDSPSSPDLDSFFSAPSSPSLEDVVSTDSTHALQSTTLPCRNDL